MQVPYSKDTLGPHTMLANNQPVELGLIGCGGFGSHLATEIFHDVEGLRLRAVYDVDRPAAQRLGKQLTVQVVGNVEEMFDISSVDAVLIATPHDTHERLTVMAAEAGKHIFCEKAMARTVDECRVMIEAAEIHGVKLMVGHKRRLRPEYARLAEIVHSGRLGKPVAATVTGFHYSDYYRGWWSEKGRSGGELHCAGAHDLDFLRFLMGDVQTVFAVEGPRISSEHDWPDSILVTLQFHGGAVGSLQVAFNYPLLSFQNSFATRIACEKGAAWYDPEQISVSWQKFGEERQEIKFSDHGYNEAYRLELKHFVEWVRQDAEPILTAENGLRCVELMQAAYQSAADGEPIQLPL